jgi:hypothetical protein
MNMIAETREKIRMGTIEALKNPEVKSSKSLWSYQARVLQKW